MTMVSSGQIQLAGTGTSGGNNLSVEVELGGSGSSIITMNDSGPRSLAGITTPASQISLSNFYGKSAFSGPYWIVAGTDGKVYRSNNSVATSFNSGTQVASGATPSIWIRSSAANPTTPFYVVGDGNANVWSSSDAVTWTQHALISGSGSPASQITAMGYANGYYLFGDFVGNFWYSNTTPPLSAYSALSYTISSYPLFGNILYSNLGGTNYYCVADGNGNAVLSTNLVTWSLYATGSVGGPNSLCYGTGYLVLGSGSSQSARQIFYSSNGSTWSSVTLAASTTFNNVYVAYGNSTFVAVDTTGKVYTTVSNPSTGWTNTAQLLASGSSSGLTPRSITFANGVFLITGDSGYTWQSANNGATWTDGATAKLGSGTLYTSAY